MGLTAANGPSILTGGGTSLNRSAPPLPGHLKK
jgi:hypothetical protein